MTHLYQSIFGNEISKTSYCYQTGQTSNRKLTFQTEERGNVYWEVFLNYLSVMIWGFWRGFRVLLREYRNTCPESCGQWFNHSHDAGCSDFLGHIPVCSIQVTSINEVEAQNEEISFCQRNVSLKLLLNTSNFNIVIKPSRWRSFVSG